MKRYTTEMAKRDFEIMRNSPEALALMGRTQAQFDSLVAKLSEPGALERYTQLIEMLEAAGPEEQVIGDLLSGKSIADILAGR